jgi:CRP-like cAMP-binding protein
MYAPACDKCSVKLARMTPGGEEHVVGTRGPGDVLGYRAVLTGKRYRLSAEPLERTIACAIPREPFLELLRDHPELQFALLIRLSRDSLRAEEHLLTRALAERGVLEPDRHEIRVIDLPALKRLARLEPSSDTRSPSFR